VAGVLREYIQDVFLTNSRLFKGILTLVGTQQKGIVHITNLNNYGTFGLITHVALSINKNA